MSRGLGKWQKLIMDAVEENGEITIYDLLPGDYQREESKATYNAINRALRSLEKQILIEFTGLAERNFYSWKRGCHYSIPSNVYKKVEDLPTAPVDMKRLEELEAVISLSVGR